VQTLDPAIYVHTFSQITLCKFLHLKYVCMYIYEEWARRG